MSAAANETLEEVPDSLKIGDCCFRARSHELERDGETLRLEPRVSSLLLYLAVRAGQPVSRAALLEALWPGMVVSDEALTNAVNKLRRAFDDDRTNPKVIETIPKTGYRLIAAVQSPAPATVQPDTVQPDTDEHRMAVVPREMFSRWLMTAAVLVILTGLVLLFGANLWRTDLDSAGGKEDTRQPAGVEQARPAIAVLPFDNLSEVPAEEYFADGITDDVITRLAKNRGLMVIARDSTFFYKGQSLDPRVIGEKLNVDYVLRGSLRREGGQLKMNAWLVAVKSGDHVWAEHYERKLDQIFEIRDDMARSISHVLAAADTGQANPLEMTVDSGAYDNLLLGRHHFYKFESPIENLKARAYFEEAIRLDSEFAMAHAMLAWTYAFEAMNGWTDDRPESLEQAERIATRAIEIQPTLSLAYYVRGLSYREQHEYVKALVEAQKGIEYDPGDANGHVLLATLLYYAGRPEEGLGLIRKAMQINPHHPYNYHFHLGQAYFVLHRYREAIDAFRQGLASNPASERMRVWLVAALARSGDIDAARWEGEQIVAANADFSLQRLAQAFPFKDPDDLEHFVSSLRLAGLR